MLPANQITTEPATTAAMILLMVAEWSIAERREEKTLDGCTQVLKKAQPVSGHITPVPSIYDLS